jgi:hypothetical protein
VLPGHGAFMELLQQALGKTSCSVCAPGAVRGLQADGAGCNPWIQLGLIEHPSCDPGYWAVVQTIRSVRDCAVLDYLQPVLTRLAWGGTEMPANSITHTLFSRLQVLGWSVRPDGRLEDFLCSFCLFDTSFHEIEYRAQLSWQAVVAQQVNHRSGLQNLQTADVQWHPPLAFQPPQGSCRHLPQTAQGGSFHT